MTSTKVDVVMDSRSRIWSGSKAQAQRGWGFIGRWDRG